MYVIYPKLCTVNMPSNNLQLGNDIFNETELQVKVSKIIR